MDDIWIILGYITHITSHIYICITMSHPIYMDDRMKSGLVTKWDIYIYMVDGVPTPLKNMSSSVWMMIPNIWKHKIHVPNHQPDIHGLYGWFIIHNHNPYFIPYIIHTNGMKTWVRLMDKLNHGSYVSGMHIQVCAS